jgi:hypothetical protein
MATLPVIRKTRGLRDALLQQFDAAIKQIDDITTAVE